MEINLDFGGLSDAVRRMRELEQATAGVARQARAAQGSVGGAGPLARAQAAQQGLASAIAGGGNTFDAQVRALRAQQSLERAQRLLNPPGPPGFGQRVSSLISTTRFGGGGALGGAMPLVGRTAAAIGGEVASGPIGMLLAAASGAVAAFTAVMNTATQAVGEFRRAATMTGGTAGETARIGAFGVRPGDQAGAAAGLRQALSSDPMAMMLAQRSLGIGPQMPRGLGQVNEAKLLELTLRRLRGLVAEGRALEALEVARALNLDAYLGELKVSERLFQAKMKDARLTEEIMGRNAARMREMEGQASRVTTAWENLAASMAGSVAPGIENLNEGLANFLNQAIEGLEELRGKEKGNWFMELFRPPFLAGSDGGTPAEKAQKENTEAVNANTRMWAQGIHGGGPLARGAVPSALRGQALEQALQDRRLSLGVFGN